MWKILHNYVWKYILQKIYPGSGVWGRYKSQTPLVGLCSDQAKDYSGLYTHLETTNVRGSAEDITGFEVGMKSTIAQGLVRTKSL